MALFRRKYGEECWPTHSNRSRKHSANCSGGLLFDTAGANVYNVQALNKPIELTEREFEMINVLAGGAVHNQRELSMKTRMSLGMTNFVLKRLVKKGLLKIRQLNRRKAEYLLTPRGFSEKAQKS